jgi:type II restriction enzyme
MVVCPIYQLPNRSSQIYQQASIRNICIFTYSHLALLVSYAKISGELKTKKLLHDILNTISALNPSKNAVDYWLAINKTILNKESTILNIWNTEKKASIESIAIAKENDLRFLASERERIMKMDHDEAIQELIKIKKIDSKIKTIKAITDNGLFEII